MITLTLTEQQADLITYALRNVEASWNYTNPLILMIAAEYGAAKAVKEAVEPLKSKEAIYTPPKPQNAPYGLKKDGKPRGRPGRPKKAK